MSTSTAKTKSGEREFGAAAAIDYDDLVLRWMDHYLRGADNGVETKDRSATFVMGDQSVARGRRVAASLKGVLLLSVESEAGRSPWHLSANAPREKKSFASFVSDPAKPVVNPYSASGAHDYRELAEQHDILTFDSAPLEQDTEVSGPIRAQIYFACDCRDTDLWVRLLDVSPDGTAFNVMGPGLDVLRASYRDLKKGRQLLTPNRVYELHLDNLITSNVFRKDHRIRVQVSATFFPNFSRNLQSGELEASSAKMQKAKISHLH